MILTSTATTQLEESAIWFFGVAGAAVMLVLAAAGILGLLYFILILAPQATQRCGRTLADRNFASFLTGIPLVLVAAVVTVMLAQTGPFLGALSLVGASLVILFGATAASEDLGRRLYFVSGKLGNRSQHLLVGWIIFVLASSLPLVGWFVILPYVLSSGVGSIVLSALRRTPPEAARPKIV